MGRNFWPTLYVHVLDAVEAVASGKLKLENVRTVCSYKCLKSPCTITSDLLNVPVFPVKYWRQPSGPASLSPQAYCVTDYANFPIRGSLRVENCTKRTFDVPDSGCARARQGKVGLVAVVGSIENHWNETLPSSSLSPFPAPTPAATRSASATQTSAG